MLSRTQCDSRVNISTTTTNFPFVQVSQYIYYINYLFVLHRNKIRFIVRNNNKQNNKKKNNNNLLVISLYYNK